MGQSFHDFARMAIKVCAASRIVFWALARIFVSSAKAVAPSKKALTLANQGFSFGAGEMNRTPDLLITKDSRESPLSGEGQFVPGVFNV
jgi:hypothetical protein